MKKLATRDAYGETLAQLGQEREDIIVLEADLSGSTRTSLFAAKFPDRFVNVGVAEQNLVGMAAGFAQAGFTPLASSFAMFLSGRAWEVVRNTVAYPALNVKLVASHGGITVGEDGASHQCIEDFSIMRTIPEMRVFIPSDHLETTQIIRFIANQKGPVYVRTGRSATAVLERDPSYSFKEGKGELRRSGADVTLIACGIMVHEADVAARILSEQHQIEATVINMASIKPIDSTLIIEMAKKTGAIVTAEEHSTIGGLGSAVSEVVCETQPVPVMRVGVEDRFGQSGKSEDLLEYYGLTAQGIVKKALQAIQLKNR